MVELPEEGDLADGGTGDALVLDFDGNLLHGHILIVFHVVGLKDQPVRALAYF